MRFMVMHKVTKQMESGEIDRTEVTNMQKFIGASIKSGVFTTGAGLKPTAFRTRLTFRGDECLVQEGPYTGVNELIAGFAMIEVKTKDEAMDWARKFAKVVGDVEVGLVVEGFDLTGSPRPPNAPMHFLILNKADPNTEAGKPPSEREQREMGALLAEMKKAGVLLNQRGQYQAPEGLLPSSKGVRLSFKGGKRTGVVDGPFAESKELIAGFSILNVASREEAIAWATQYGSILMDKEVDVRALHDTPAG